MGQNHTVIHLEDYRRSREGVGRLPEHEPRGAGPSVPEISHAHTYTEVAVPHEVEPFVTVHQERPQVSAEVQKLGVSRTETTPTYKEPSVLTELGLTIQKVLDFIKGTPKESSSWLGHHAHRQLRRGGNVLDTKTGEVLEKAA